MGDLWSRTVGFFWLLGLRSFVGFFPQVDGLAGQLADLVRRGEGNSPQAKAIAQKLNDKLNELKNKIHTALLQRVVEDFVDIGTPLKQFTDAVLAPEGTLPFHLIDFEYMVDHFQIDKIWPCGDEIRPLFWHSHDFTVLRAQERQIVKETSTTRHVCSRSTLFALQTPLAWYVLGRFVGL